VYSQAARSKVILIIVGIYNKLHFVKPHSNGPLYSNSVIGTLALDGHVVGYIWTWYSEEGPWWVAALPSPLVDVLKEKGMMQTSLQLSNRENVALRRLQAYLCAKFLFA